MAGSAILDGEKIRAHIETLQRTPFRDLLGDYLACAPTKEALEDFANAFPDRYAKAVAALATLAGYKETVTHEHNFLIAIRDMSDAEIKMRLEQLETRPIEGEYELIEREDGPTSA